MSDMCGNLHVYDDILYVCDNCGWDELRANLHEINDPLPQKLYWTYTCEECEAEHINRDNLVFLEKKQP